MAIESSSRNNNINSSSSRTNNNWIFSLQVLLISIAILSLAFVLKLSLPAILDFLITQVPELWNSMNSWFTRPYLYIVINGIIITIAASSRLHQYHYKIHGYEVDDQMEILTTPAMNKIHQQQKTDVTNQDFFVSSSLKEDDFGSSAAGIKPELESMILDYEVEFLKNPMVSTLDLEKFVPEVYENATEAVFAEQVKTMISSTKQEGEEIDFADSNTILTPNRTDSMEIPSEYSFSEEKPPVSTRFNHRKIAKGSNEGGKVMKRGKQKRNDTLESTWKTITEGRSIPLARHLKKSDTWESHSNAGPHTTSSSSSAGLKEVKKSETFKDSQSSMNAPSRGSVRLRKEPSLSQDELNRRVEAFINKFNEEMRLQRQASLNQYKEMVTRVGHNN